MFLQNFMKWYNFGMFVGLNWAYNINWKSSECQQRQHNQHNKYDVFKFYRAFKTLSDWTKLLTRFKFVDSVICDVCSSVWWEGGSIIFCFGCWIWIRHELPIGVCDSYCVRRTEFHDERRKLNDGNGKKMIENRKLNWIRFDWNWNWNWDLM